MLALDWGERRLANVHKLLRLARRFEAAEGRDLRGFLDHVEHLASAGRVEPDAPVEGVEPDAVRLMTIHAAKGLEFPVVCVADLGRQPSSRTPDLLVDGDRVGLRLVRPRRRRLASRRWTTRSCAPSVARAKPRRRTASLYVAMTRARERLLLSGAVASSAGRAGARRARRSPGWRRRSSPELPQLLAGGAATAGEAAPAPDALGVVPAACRCA